MENLSGYDPLVFGDVTLLDILACERGVRGESLDAAVSFYKRLMSSNERQAKRELFVLQAKLWDVEQKLNAPMNERIVFEQGWLNGPSYELAHLFVRMTERLSAQSAALEEMNRKHGHPDGLRAIVESMMPDVIKAVQAYVAAGGRLDAEDRFPGFPRGFRYMNAREVDDLISDLRELRHKYEAKLVERKQAREAETAHRQRLADEYARRQDLCARRKSEMEGELNEFNQLVVALLGHTHFCRIGLVSPSPLKLSYVTESQLGTIGEPGYKLLLDDLRKKVANEKRKLREPMRRIWQSVQSRGVTRLAFEAYLKQEGFGHLLP
jgi:hypothetical protein